ncbi:APH(3') family aminoglycoside O-phosphotransferase [Deinococcus sonorensis]|uniref:APH(3') family aminoglycoside O-phosphotransferase n=2 Tax=Deinococcus sonorensis TaxID=309891 RepID=A0AAU7UE62_9DEIO
MDRLPELPDTLRRVVPAARWEPVTDGMSGAGVWRSQRYVLKVMPRRALQRPLQEEQARLRWLAGRVPVPQVVGYELTPDREFLAMTRLPGVPMHHPDALLHPERVATLLARALRELHALPVRDCPFTMTLAVMLRLARERVEAGLVDVTDFDPERQGRGAAWVLEELRRTRPPHEDLVVTHGDACLPNVLMAGEYVEGFVDVGRAGLADRHADLALAERSLRHNIGPEAAALFLDTYGRSFVDPARLTYYRLLDELF